MFGYVAIVKGLLQLGNVIARYFKDEQLINAGENKAKAEMGHEQIKRINEANIAVNNVKHDDDSVREDADNRRNR